MTKPAKDFFLGLTAFAALWTGPFAYQVRASNVPHPPQAWVHSSDHGDGSGDDGSGNSVNGGGDGGYYGGGTAGSGGGSGSGNGGSDDSGPGGNELGIRFFGIVQSVPPAASSGDWQIGGYQVTASSSTKIDSGIAAGSCVEVEAIRQSGGSLAATAITLEDASRCGVSGPGEQGKIEFFGNIVSLPDHLIGDWVVAGRTIHVIQGTEVKQDQGPAVAGACVDIQGDVNPDTSISAREIKVVSGAGGCASAPENLRMDVEFKGIVQSSPEGGQTLGKWQIAGRTVQVTSETRVPDRVPLPGSCVEVRGLVGSDGTVGAQRIDTEDSGDCQKTSLLRFDGTVQSLPGGGITGDWLVGGLAVHVDASTIIEAHDFALAAGTCVEVRGTAANDGSVDAVEVMTVDSSVCNAGLGMPDQFEIEGTIESLPIGSSIGEWHVAGHTVRVTGATTIDSEHGALMLGACAEVKGTLQSDGSLAATTIESRTTSGTCLFTHGILNAASFTSGPVSPGQIISLFGVDVGTSTDRSMQVSEDRLATRLGNVRVLFDGVAAPLIFVSRHQVNVMVPGTVKPAKEVEIQVENNGAWSNPVRATVKPASPALFTLTQAGRGQGAILNYESDLQDYSANTESNPAKRGSVIVLYGTGYGGTENGDDGVISRSASPTKLPVRVRIGDRDAEVEYAGSAPGLVSGVFQVNVRVPDDVTAGSRVPILVLVGDDRGQDGVTVAIK